MKKIFSLVASVLCATAMMAQEPVITFEKDTHDFGKINEADGRVTTVFNFKNEGMSPLVLSNVRASCGCTTPKWTKEPIEPGATGAITVTYNPNGRPGKFSKTITVTSNAKEPTMRLYIKGEVIPKPAQPVNKYQAKIGELSITSKQVNLGDLLKGQSKTQTIEYANQTNEVIIVGIVSCPQYMVAQANLLEIKPNETGAITVNFDAAKCPVYGPAKGKIYLVVNGQTANTDDYAIAISANIKEDFSQLTDQQKLNAPIADMAQEFDLGVVAANKKVTKSIIINNAGVNALFVRRIIAPNEMQFPAIKNGWKKGKKEIKFTINSTNMTAGKHQNTITVITNDYKNPIQTIKLNWEVR